MPGGLLFVLAEPPVDAATAFGRWYDEHASARLTIPGVTSAQRYWATDAEPPRHMAFYDLESLEVLDAPDYRQLRRHRPPGEEAMITSLPLRLDRRIYVSLDDAAASREGESDPTSYVLAVWMSARDEPDLHRWYTEEHIPKLLQVPGWRRCRRFERVEGGGPKFLALHDLVSLDVFDTPGYQEARKTPWRERIAKDRTAYERRLYRLAKRLTAPASVRGGA